MRFFDYAAVGFFVIGRVVFEITLTKLTFAVIYVGEGKTKRVSAIKCISVTTNRDREERRSPC